MSALAALSQEIHGDVEDEADRSANYQLAANLIALEAHREKAKPPAQLKRVDGTVLCRECEEPIPLVRLERLPDAAFCVDCLAVLELREKLNR